MVKRTAHGGVNMRLPFSLRLVLVLGLLAALLAHNRLALITARAARANEGAASFQGEVLYVPDTRLSRAMAMGYDQAAADLLWIRTIGYFSEHFTTDRRYTWLEHFVEQILELDPRWRLVYHWAGASVLYGRRFTNENINLSSGFYQRALERFPEDYEAAYRLGLNYYVEMRSADPAERRRYQEIGLSWLELAANMPSAPGNIRSLVASVSRRLGKSQLALQYLIDLYLSTDDPEQRAELRLRMEDMKAEQGDAEELAAAAARFQSSWKSFLPYVSPPLFALLGEPEQIGTPDRPWPTLVPDIEAREATDLESTP
jgi:hypothetical protein